MTEEAGTDEVVTGALSLSAGSFRDSRTEGDQSFSLERGEHELKAQTVTHNLQLERMRTEHELEETRRDNQERRRRDKIVFTLVVVGTIVGLVIGLLVAIWGQDADARRWGQALVTLIIGALGGYLTGSKSGK